MNSKRPVIKIELNPLEWILNGLSILIITGTCFYYFLKSGTIPDRIPTHFDAAGVPNGWGGKGSLIVLPTLMLVMFVLLSVLERFPQIFNYLCEITEGNARFQYHNARMMLEVLKFLMMCMFAWIEVAEIKVALGGANGLGLWFLPFTMALVFGSLIFFIVRMVRNA